MQIDSWIEDQCLVVSPKVKRLDAAVAVEFRQVVAGLLNTSPGAAIVLDLGEVKFLDSSGLGAIVSIFKLISGRVPFRVCSLQESVRALFALTRMDKVFSIFPTREAALAG